MKKYISTVYIALIFAILYIPILTVILFSFNATESTANFSGFSFYWYNELFSNKGDAFTALCNSLILAVLSAPRALPRLLIVRSFTYLIFCSNLTSSGSVL